MRHELSMEENSNVRASCESQFSSCTRNGVVFVKESGRSKPIKVSILKIFYELFPNTFYENVNKESFVHVVTSVQSNYWSHLLFCLFCVILIQLNLN